MAVKILSKPSAIGPALWINLAPENLKFKEGDLVVKFSSLSGSSVAWKALPTPVQKLQAPFTRDLAREILHWVCITGPDFNVITDNVSLAQAVVGGLILAQYVNSCEKIPTDLTEYTFITRLILGASKGYRVPKRGINEVIRLWLLKEEFPLGRVSSGYDFSQPGPDQRPRHVRPGPVPLRD